MTDTFELVLRNATVIGHSSRRHVDLCVRNGKVAALAAAGSATGERVLDVTDHVVFPGMVDTHVHLMEPGDASRENFLDGTAAAAGGGVTTIVEHTHGWPVTSPQRLTDKRAALAGRSHVDYGLAAHLVPANLTEVGALWSAGVTFFKIFTCTTHGIEGLDAANLLDGFEQLARNDATALVHCEDQSITARREAELRDAGRNDPELLAEWRCREAEVVATSVVAKLSRSTGARIALAHASTSEVLDDIAAARQAGANVVAETCPQYAFLRQDEINSLGGLRKFTPPARIRSAVEADAMWTATNDGRVHHLSTDHAPSTVDQKTEGSIWDVHFGLPGLDTTFRLMLDAAIKGRISHEKVVQLYSWAPARFYRLPGKGSLSIGADADIVVVDPRADVVLSNDMVRSAAGWTPYAGRALTGDITAVFLRGRQILDGRDLNEPGGRFIPGPGARRDAEGGS